MKVILRCPLCREKFKYDVAEGFPDDCQVCGKRIAHDREDDDVVIPYFLSDKTKKTDGVARQIMDGSEQRAEMAAAMAGVPVSEMSGLKVTNLNDRNDAEMAAVKVNNAVTQHMDAMNARGMPVGFQRTEAMQAASIAHSGSEPYAGARMRAKLWNKHHEGSMIAAPEMLPKEIYGNPHYVKRG